MKNAMYTYELTEYERVPIAVYEMTAREIAQALGMNWQYIYGKQAGHVIANRYKVLDICHKMGKKIFKLEEFEMRDVSSEWGTNTQLCNKHGLSYFTLWNAYKYGYLLAGKYKVTDRRRAENGER